MDGGFHDVFFKLFGLFCVVFSKELTKSKRGVMLVQLLAREKPRGVHDQRL